MDELSVLRAIYLLGSGISVNSDLSSNLIFIG